MGHRSSQIFTDKLFQVRLAAEGAVQHRLRQEISQFFFAEGDGVYWFLNLCASVKICVQHLVAGQRPNGLSEMPDMMTNYLNKVNKSFFSFDKNYVINNIERAARISSI